LRGTKGTEFFPKLCQATKTPSGVWVEYWWPKPGEKRGSRKVSYALEAGDTPYIVGAGIYDDKTNNRGFGEADQRRELDRSHAVSNSQRARCS